MMDKTIQVLQNAVKAAPDNWEGRRHLIELLLEKGETEAAARQLAVAPAIPDDEGQALFAADVYLKSDSAKGLALIEKVLEQNTACGAAHMLKAKFYREIGQDANARKHYTTATVLDPSLHNDEFDTWALAPATGAQLEAEVSAARPAPPPNRRQSAKTPPPPRRSKPAAAVPPAVKKKPAVPRVPPSPRRPAAVAPAPSVPPPVEGPAAVTLAPSAAPPVEESPVAPEMPVQESEGRIEPAGPVSAPEVAAEVPAAAKAAVATSFGMTVPVVVDTAVKTQISKRKAMAFLTAGVAHAFLAVLFVFWVFAPPLFTKPEIVVSAPHAQEEEQAAKMKSMQQRLPEKPSSSSQSRSQVITSDTASEVNAPLVEDETVTDDPLGAGDDFGFGVGWGDGTGSGGGGGTVQFFGEKQKAKRVAYVVDFSYSMFSRISRDKTRIESLKDELIKSVRKLPPTMNFNIIYFSGSGWIAGEDPEGAKYQKRLQESFDGNEPRLKIKWLDASKENKSKTIKVINAMPLAGQQTGGGTMWTPPIKLALQMQPPPDLIYLLTDGDAHDRDGFLGNLKEIVPPKIPIHTIALELPGEVAQSLVDIAEKTGGDFTMVMEGKAYTGDRAKKYTDPKYNPGQ